MRYTIMITADVEHSLSHYSLLHSYNSIYSFSVSRSWRHTMNNVRKIEKKAAKNAMITLERGIKYNAQLSFQKTDTKKHVVLRWKISILRDFYLIISSDRMDGVTTTTGKMIFNALLSFRLFCVCIQICVCIGVHWLQNSICRS